MGCSMAGSLKQWGNDLRRFGVRTTAVSMGVGTSVILGFLFGDTSRDTVDRIAM